MRKTCFFFAGFISSYLYCTFLLYTASRSPNEIGFSSVFDIPSLFFYLCESPCAVQYCINVSMYCFCPTDSCCVVVAIQWTRSRDSQTYTISLSLNWTQENNRTQSELRLSCFNYPASPLLTRLRQAAVE
jgi:hypothetical protein